MENKIIKTENDWKKTLTLEEYRVLRERGTEAAFSGEYWNEHAKGMYRCRACGADLFSSEAKFDSGTGWPSFTQPARLSVVELTEDLSHGMRRTEVICKRCGSHLGHVFDDLPRVAGKEGVLSSPRATASEPKRFCINSCALKLDKK